MTKRKISMRIDIETLIELNVCAAQQDIKFTELAQKIFDEFVKNNAKNDNNSVS